MSRCATVFWALGQFISVFEFFGQATDTTNYYVYTTIGIGGTDGYTIIIYIHMLVCVTAEMLEQRACAIGIRNSRQSPSPGERSYTVMTHVSPRYATILWAFGTY